MDLKSGPIERPPSWNRLLNQAADLTRPLAEKSVAKLQAQAEACWHDTADFCAGPPVAPARQIALVEPTSGGEKAPAPKITVGTRVLIIGDSQTVGPYGKTIDELARATGATVSTHASWGASPPWFFSGHEAYKNWSRDSTGQQETQMKASTPLLNDLLAAERPDVVVVTMGGNMIASGASQADVTLQVSQIGNAVSASGAQLIWVGPPKYDPDKRSPELVEQFYQKLENIVPEFGRLIDSRKHISEYAGSDGLHYSGDKGEKIARQWANGVFQEIQKLD